MKKTITYKELKEIKTNPYRRIIIFSKFPLKNFKDGAFNNYIKIENMENIIEKYMICVEKTQRTEKTQKNLPYLFIFKDVEIPENKEFFESANWLIIK